MFGLFKKKEPQSAPSKIVRLMEIFEALSVQADDLYAEVESYNPAEVRFFTMSAMSIFIQSHCNLPETDMQKVVGDFTDQAIASLIFKMPRASFEMLHDAFADRFPDYTDPIVELSNAADGKRLQDALYGLMTIVDQHARVERDAVDKAIPGLKAYRALNAAEAEVHHLFH